MSNNNNDDTDDVFVYMGECSVVPRDVIRVRVHTSVTAIPRCAFENCIKLEEVEVCEGLSEIGVQSFSNCKSLKQIKIPSTVLVIRDCAFYECSNLEEVNLCEGLLIEIGTYAFGYCKALKNIYIPSTVKQIGESAFWCVPLISVHLPDGIKSVGNGIFGFSNLTRLRIPQSITAAPNGMLNICRSIFSLEISEDTLDISSGRGCNGAFYGCTHLRNIALPLDVEVNNVTSFSQAGFDDTSLQSLFKYSPEKGMVSRQIIYALKHRFDNLPIHKMIYYQSYNNVTPERLNEAITCNGSGNQQDCLGMTPLHILACSTVQHISLYRVLIEKYPESLVIKDKWGTLPLFYAVLENDASSEQIIQLLVRSYNSFHPNYEINWTEMVNLLGLASVSKQVIRNLVRVQQVYFPDYSIDWGTIIENTFNPVMDDPGCFSIALAKRETFHTLFQLSISDRIEAIRVKQLRDDIKHVECYSSNDENAETTISKRRAYIADIELKLAQYGDEQHRLLEATSMLELIMWKSKINASEEYKRTLDGSSNAREQFRVNCGANVVIQNVLPYLMPFIIPRPGVNGFFPNILRGKKLHLTGTFHEMGGGKGSLLGKDRMKGMIEAFGGEARDCWNIGNDTDLLVVGKGASKYQVSEADKKNVLRITFRGLTDRALKGKPLAKTDHVEIGLPPGYTGERILYQKKSNKRKEGGYTVSFMRLDV